MRTSEYFKRLEEEVNAVYSIAEAARQKGLDPRNKVEIPLARSLAEKVVGLIASIYPQIEDKRIVNRILELEKKYGSLEPAVSLRIAEEIAKQKFCKFSSLLEAIDAGIRVGFAYSTLGVVSSPIEGYTQLKTNLTMDGKEYFVAYFSGPIRSAGTTASCVALIIINYLREIFGFEKYDPTEEEVKRMVTELYDYHERITNLQYLPTEEEIEFLVRNFPIQINGDPTEDREVSNYKNLKRIETDFIRGGVALILGEGLAQKAPKAFRILKKLKKEGFVIKDLDFLEEYVDLHKKREEGKKDASPTYIQDLVAGRPVFGHPSASGGFRFRYGRSRVAGFSAVSMHPATMQISDEFIAIGTQLKIEKPTKGCAVSSCDSIDGPIVKLFSGSVKKLQDMETAKKLYSDIEEIIYIGDILFPFGDLANRNHDLILPGYVEEWWKLELQEKNRQLAEKINEFKVSFESAVELSRKFKIPLHPKFIFYWSQISKEQFAGLLEWLKHSRIEGKIILPYGRLEQEKYSMGKRALELLGVEHEVTIENVVLSSESSKALFANLGLDFGIFKENAANIGVSYTCFEKAKEEESVLRAVNLLSEFKIKDKAGEFIGARMGRPEKAKLRKLSGSPNVLFPVGSEGGRLRSIQEACKIGSVKSAFPIYYCAECKKETIYYICERCGKSCRKMKYCPDCGQMLFLKEEDNHEHARLFSFSNRVIDINYYFNKAIEHLEIKKEEMPVLVKGVRGTSSEEHTIENLGKGILRALFGLSVNKDGTIRYDVTEMPITHFKPKEISVSVKKLRDLGYVRDIHGKELISEEQLLELKPHDIILPCCPDSPEERADDVFIKIANFVDSLLVRFYKLKPFYNVRRREDLIGHLGVCMAPHNCAGVISRIIGFSKTQGLLASPYMHAAMRRDCDGDEAAIMLLLDVLINFSRDFLPAHRGGTQDAPLVLNSRINAGEVDDQILDFELVSEYPLKLYQLAEQRVHSSEVDVPMVKDRLREGGNPFKNIYYTHDTRDFNEGVLCSSYKRLATMQEKVQHQMGLVDKLRAADTSDVARLIIERHFIRDIRGNLRKFSMQQFRCVKCNEKFRRPPLSGVCSCGGKIIFTISEGGIIKYLEPAMSLINKYNVSPYIKQSLELTKRYIESVFGREEEKQESLQRWF